MKKFEEFHMQRKNKYYELLIFFYFFQINQEVNTLSFFKRNKLWKYMIDRKILLMYKNNKR